MKSKIITFFAILLQNILSITTFYAHSSDTERFLRPTFSTQLETDLTRTTVS
jgi:hypothetical protein